MNTVPALRTHTLTPLEEQLIWLLADDASRRLDLSDDTLIEVMALRDRFKPEEDQ